MTTVGVRTLRRGDAGSLPLAMLLTLITVGMSLVLLATVLQQATSTRADLGRIRALDAASTGLEIGVGAMRISVHQDGRGAAEGLQCTAITGAVISAGARYAVTMRYFLTDPRGHDASWWNTNGTPCATTLPEAPRFARLTAVGTDAISGRSRTLFGVYAFKLATNVNVAGGRIKMFVGPTDVTELCLDAGSSTPGTVVSVKPCTATTDDRQTFAYTPDLTVVVVSSLASYPQGLCLDAGVPGTLGAVVKLQVCGSPTLIRQQ